jgi:DNA modification methylase
MKILQGDCKEVLKTLPDNSVDSIVTDPPYELGFMGKSWDNTGIANDKNMWAECLRVLKPGGHLLAFSGTRTYHRMASAIEDAGFEVRDMIEWVYGSGFPKSLNIGKAVDKLQGNEREEYIDEDFIKRNPKDNNDGVFESGLKDGIDGAKRTKGTSEWEGWGTALKPAHEPIAFCRKPIEKGLTVAENCLKWGTGGINIDGSRVGLNGDKKTSGGCKTREDNQSHLSFRGGQVNKEDNTVGRFPANLVLEDCDEVRECFPETKSKGHFPSNNKNGNSIFNTNNLEQEEQWLDDLGNASRFFKSIVYVPKSSKSERNRGCEELEEKEGIRTNAPRENEYVKTPKRTNNHPTVKPIALMEYLIKMVTPPIVFVCEKCYNVGYEKQKTNSDSTQLSNMRDTIQAEGQSTQGEVLHKEVCLSGGENNNRDTLSVLQKNVSAEEGGQTSSDLLQSELCGETHRNNKEVKSATKNKKGLFSDLQTRTPNVKQARDGFTTPNNNGGTLGEESTSDRDSSSQEPQERRQPNRELGNNDTETTQPNSKIKEENNLSTLSGNRRCPKCGESMVKRAGIVLDPFAGSGSTLVAAKQNGYDYIGIEMEQEYIKIIEARLKKLSTKY